MTRTLTVFRVLPVVAVLLMSGANVARAADNPVIAKVNGQEIHLSAVKDYLKVLPKEASTMPLEQVFPMIQEQIVMGRLISDHLETEKFAEEPDVKARLDLMTQNALRGFYMEKLVEAKVTDKAIKKEYDKFAKDFKPQEELRAQHILVEDEAKAKEVIAKLDKGEKFEDLVKQYSKDKGAKEDGDLGYFKTGEMVKEFSDAAFAMKKGKYSTEPVKTAFGYHVIKLLDRRQTQPPAFDQVKDSIRTKLQQEALQEILKSYRDAAKIELFDAKGNPIPGPEKAAAGGAAAGAAVETKKDAPKK